jgi:glycosyltransferase involved in cell wall biosynthesis
MRFVFMVTYRNCAPFLVRCAESLLAQDHVDWVAYFRDDASTDGGSDLLPADPRIVVQRRPERGGGLRNVHEGIVTNPMSPDDVVCWMDGDDYLVGSGALGVVAGLYRRRDCLVSYGQYETCQSGTGHCRAYTRAEFAGLRSCGFVASHLKTFRHKVYMEAMRQDPGCERYRDGDGGFFDMANDVALMTPLLEIAGFDRVAFNPEVVYHYTIHGGNESSVDSARQRDCARAALAKNPMTRADL